LCTKVCVVKMCRTHLCTGRQTRWQHNNEHRGLFKNGTSTDMTQCCKHPITEALWLAANHHYIAARLHPHRCLPPFKPSCNESQCMTWVQSHNTFVTNCEQHCAMFLYCATAHRASKQPKGTSVTVIDSTCVSDGSCTAVWSSVGCC